MFNAKGILDQLVGSGIAGGFAGGLAGGALANALSGKKGRKLAGNALKVGGLALVGGVAYKAWQKYQQSDQAALVQPAGEVAGATTAFVPDAADQKQTNALSLLLIRSMIAAAKADGQIDSSESQAILQQINESQLSAEDKAFLLDEYNRPLSVESLVQAVDTPEHAAEVYAASLLILDPPNPAETIYLDSLASAMRLDPGLVREIHNSIEASREAA